MDEKTKVAVEPFHGTVNVMFSDAMLASTKEAFLLREEEHDPVLYIPFPDIYFEFLSPSETEYRCPRKGKARYWNARAVGEAEQDVMWTYDQPPPAINAIREHGAFDSRKVRTEVQPQEDLRHRPHMP